MSALSKADLLISYADNIIGAIKALTHRNLVDSLLGGLASLLVVGGSTSQTVTASPTLMTGWAANGLAVGCVADHTVDYMTVDTDGVYRAGCDVCFSGTSSRTFMIAIYKDVGSGFVDAGIMRIHRKLGTGGDVGSSRCHGDLSLATGDKVAAYVWSTDGGTSFVPQEATLSLKRIG